jgi:hypothetical protein
MHTKLVTVLGVDPHDSAKKAAIGFEIYCVVLQACLRESVLHRQIRQRLARAVRTRRNRSRNSALPVCASQPKDGQVINWTCAVESRG